MQCQRCGKDLGSATRCNFCGYENGDGNVREMTRRERNFFNGVTIDAGSADSRSSYENFHDDRRYETRGTYINFTGGGLLSRVIGSFVRAILGGNRLAQIAAAMIFLAFGALMFFVAVPILFVLLALGVAFLALSKISR